MGAKILIIVASGGGGHRATARAIIDGCILAKKDYQFETLDLSAVLGVGAHVGDVVYNWLLSSGRARWMPTWHAIGRAITNLNDHNLTEQFRTELAKHTFDAVITCIPYVNVLVCNALSTLKTATPLITVISDFENSVDHPWMQDHRQYLICGTEVMLKQAEAFGHPSERIYGTSGMVIHPSFYEPLPKSRSEELQELGLNPEWRTACIFFGGFAPVFVPSIIKSLRNMDESLNIIALCGNTRDDIEHALSEPDDPEHSRLLTVGFTTNVAYYMKLSDFLIGKPGPGVTSEALVAKLPVVVELNEEHTPPQEKIVADYISRTGIGLVVNSYEEIPRVVTRARIDACRRRLELYSNNAVFEVPHIISGILEQSKQRKRRIMSVSGADLGDGVPRSRSNSRSTVGSPSFSAVPDMGSSSDEQIEPLPGLSREVLHSLLEEHDKWEQLKSISITSSSYLDYVPVFEEPLRLDDDDHANPTANRILINASGRWGHDVIGYSLRAAMDPETIEFHFSCGYEVTWFKEIVISNGDFELHRAATRNEDRGPKVITVHPDDFDTGNIKVDFFKAGFLGVHTHAYTRYIDAHRSVGSAIHIIWSRDRFSSTLRS